MRSKSNRKDKSFFAQTLVASIWFVLAFTFSCSSDNDSNSSSSGGGDSSSSSGGGGTFKDDRDSKSYKWVKIGEQTWMAENLNYRGTEPDTLGICYGNDPDNCTKYGRLYTWTSAMDVCPSSWHLPSEEEWDKLEASVRSTFGCTVSNEECLKAKTGWYNNGNGTDGFGFTALPGGYGFEGEFYEEGKLGVFWGSSEEHELPWGLEDWGYFRDIGYNSNGHGYNEKTNMFSVRCLKN